MTKKIAATLAVLLSICAASSSAFQTPAAAVAARRPSNLSPLRSSIIADEEVDCIVIGSGIGGLSCAGLLAATGRTVKVLERHYEIGGCAHNFYMDLDGKAVPSASIKNLSARKDLFHFEAGPSLYSGLSDD